MLSTIAEFFFNGDSANIGDRPSGIDGFLTGLPGRSLADTALLSRTINVKFLFSFF